MPLINESTGRKKLPEPAFACAPFLPSPVFWDIGRGPLIHKNHTVENCEGPLNMGRAHAYARRQHQSILHGNNRSRTRSCGQKPCSQSCEPKPCSHAVIRRVHTRHYSHVQAWASMQFHNLYIAAFFPTSGAADAYMASKISHHVHGLVHGLYRQSSLLRIQEVFSECHLRRGSFSSDAAGRLNRTHKTVTPQPSDHIR